MGVSLVEPNVRVGRQRAEARADSASFAWSPAKLRTAGLILLGAAMPAAFGFLAPSVFTSWLCLGWLLGVALLMHSLGRRAAAETIVLVIDEHGILDRRLMSKRISWQEIAAVCRVDLDRSHVVDIKLRWPAVTLAGSRWQVRIGAACQRGYGVPAVTISMLLLDGQPSELLAAVARYRPDLLHPSNRDGLRDE
jgi:hypothetical protein